MQFREVSYNYILGITLTSNFLPDELDEEGNTQTDLWAEDIALETARAMPVLFPPLDDSKRGGKLDSSRKLITRLPPEVVLPSRSNTEG